MLRDEIYELNNELLKKRCICIYHMKNSDLEKQIKTYINNVYTIHSDYSIHSYDELKKIVCYEETSKINDEEFLFYIICDDSDEWLKLTLKFLVKNNINNIKLYKYQDYDILKKAFYRKYLHEKNIEVNNEILSIDGFTFANPLKEKFEGVYLWGDLVLPAFFNDFSMIEEGLCEYGDVTIEKNDVVIDCGANIGSFTAFARHKGGIVHAFEPIKETFANLQKNLCVDNMSNIHLNNVGLSNKIGDMDFYVDNRSSASGYVDIYNFKNKVTCKITTIDEYVKNENIPKVDFIKADIEGAERDMLIGAIETIKRDKPKMVICTYHLEDDPIIIQNIIKTACEEYKFIHMWKKIYAYV